MSTKLSIDQFIVANAVSGATSFNGAPSSTKKLDNVGYQFNVSGSCVGVATIQTSYDYAEASDRSVINSGNWQTVPGLSGSVNGAGAGTLELTTMPGPWIRPVYTATSGAGTITIYINAKSGL